VKRHGANAGKRERPCQSSPKFPEQDLSQTGRTLAAWIFIKTTFMMQGVEGLPNVPDRHQNHVGSILLKQTAGEED
jgi:hypothetical protein